MTEQPGTAVAVPASRVPVNLNDPLEDLDGAFRLAQMLAQSSMVPQALRGSPQNCLVTMMLGRDLGLTWIQAIRGIYVLPNGTPGLRGALLLARIRTAGHRYQFTETDDSCTFTITRKDEDHKIPYAGTFTVDDAKAAGLVTEKDGKLIARSRSGEPMPWEQYRKDMLQWRAVARGANRGVPELVFGMDIAGLGDSSEGSPVIAATGPVEAQIVPETPDETRARLEELNRRHDDGSRLVTPAGENDTTSGTGDSGADYEVPVRDDGRQARHPEASTTPDPSAAGASAARGAQQSPPPAPTVKSVVAAMENGGMRGPAALDAASVLVRRENIKSWREVTKADLIILSQTLAPIAAERDPQTAQRLMTELIAREQEASFGADDE